MVKSSTIFVTFLESMNFTGVTHHCEIVESKYMILSFSTLHNSELIKKVEWQHHIFLFFFVLGQLSSLATQRVASQHLFYNVLRSESKNSQNTYRLC